MIGDHFIFHHAPKPFNGVEMRGILGQEEHGDTGLSFKPDVDFFGGVSRGVIDDEPKMTAGASLDNVVQESQEVGRVEVVVKP